MSQTYEPHRLVIQYLSVLESAPAIVEEVEKKLFAAMNEKIMDWVKKRQDQVWEGIYSFYDDKGETSFKPISWVNNENEEDWIAWYTLTTIPDEDSFQHWLSPLLGVTSTEFGFMFGVREGYVTNLTEKRARPAAAWKSYLAAQFNNFPTIEANGFRIVGGNLFLPFKLYAQDIADAYPDSLGDALMPIDEALNKLGTAHPEIDALLKKARDYSFAK